MTSMVTIAEDRVISSCMVLITAFRLGWKKRASKLLAAAWLVHFVSSALSGNFVGRLSTICTQGQVGNITPVVRISSAVATNVVNAVVQKCACVWKLGAVLVWPSLQIGLQLCCITTSCLKNVTIVS